MKKYLDMIIECPNGFAPALGELLALGLDEYIKWNEDETMPIGLNKVNRFYPQVPTFNDPAILYVRGYTSDLVNLTTDYSDPENPVEREFTNINILVSHPAKGEQVETGEVDQEGNLITRYKDIYEKLQEDAVATATYQSYIFWPEFLEDGVTPNPKLQETIEIEDEEGNLIIIPNPKYQPFRAMGMWA